MNFFEQFVNFISVIIPRPENNGWFPGMFFCFTIIGTIILCITAKNTSETKFSIIVFVCWLVMLVLEICKQLVFSFHFDGETVTWLYDWSEFPYQFCSTPLYVYPFIFCMRDGPVRDAFISCMISFAFFGGFVTYMHPTYVFVPELIVDIQTMVHHGLQMMLAVFFAVYFRKRLSLKFFAKGILVFLPLVTIAVSLNLLAPTFTSMVFNMFYISPYFPPILIVLDQIYASVPYIVFLMIYIVGFIIAAFIVFMIMWGIIKLVQNHKTKKQAVVVSKQENIQKKNN